MLQPLDALSRGTSVEGVSQMHRASVQASAGCRDDNLECLGAETRLKNMFSFLQS